MKTELENIDLFDQYVNGNLEADVKSAFEQRLKSDGAFEESFRLYKTMVGGIQLYEENKMRRQIRGIIQSNKNYFNTNKTLIKMKKNLSFQFAAAAAVLLLLSTGIYFYLKFESVDQKMFAEIKTLETQDVQLYMDHLTAPGFAAMNIGRVDSLQEAIELFTEGNYVEARKSFASYLKVYPDELIAIFHLAEIEMIDQNYEKAIPHYQVVAYAADFELRDYAQMHMGQCLLLFEGKSAKKIAIKLFKMVLDNPNSKLHPHARAIIEMNQ